jgi:bifunctional DNase/RNase
MVEVRLLAVKVDVQNNSPVLLLQEVEGAKRTLPIYIGAPEATSIALVLQGVEPVRPLTHDLIKDILDTAEISLEKVVITELRDRIFFAELHLFQAGRRLSVSSRPSDAVAIAIRVGAPIFVNDELMEAEGILLGEEALEEEAEGQAEETNPEQIVGQFRKFLETVTPEDFRRLQEEEEGNN